MDLENCERLEETLTFLRDALLDYRQSPVIGYEIFRTLLNDSKLKLRVSTHMGLFYPEGLVKGLKP